MAEGNTEEYPPGGYTIHKWRDGWWALWMHPMHDVCLGRELLSDLQLRNFLKGNMNAGFPILPTTHILPELLWQKKS